MYGFSWRFSRPGDLQPAERSADGWRFRGRGPPAAELPRERWRGPVELPRQRRPVPLLAPLTDVALEVHGPRLRAPRRVAQSPERNRELRRPPDSHLTQPPLSCPRSTPPRALLPKAFHLRIDKVLPTAPPQASNVFSRPFSLLTCGDQFPARKKISVPICEFLRPQRTIHPRSRNKVTVHAAIIRTSLQDCRTDDPFELQLLRSPFRFQCNVLEKFQTLWMDIANRPPPHPCPSTSWR